MRWLASVHDWIMAERKVELKITLSEEITGKDIKIRAIMLKPEILKI